MAPFEKKAACRVARPEVLRRACSLRDDFLQKITNITGSFADFERL